MSDLSNCATTVMAKIEIGLGANGEVFMRSEMLGRKDSVYMPFAHAELVPRVEKLAQELRAQMVAELRAQLAANEAALASRR